MSALRLKSLEPSDFIFVHSLVREARGEGREAGECERWALSWTESQLDRELGAARKFLVETEAHVPAGFVLFRPPGSAWDITLIAVGLGFRRQGVATQLISAVATEARLRSSDASERRVLLEVRSDNEAALQAYAKTGFSIVDQRSGYYPDGCAAVILELHVD